MNKETQNQASLSEAIAKTKKWMRGVDNYEWGQNMYTVYTEADYNELETIKTIEGINAFKERMKKRYNG